MKFPKSIDASSELGSLDGERGPSTLENQRKPAPRGAKAFMLITVAALLTGAGTLTWQAWKMRTQKEQEAAAPAAPTLIGNRLPPLTLSEPQPPPAPAAEPKTTAPVLPDIPALPQTLPAFLLPPAMPAAAAPDATRERRLSSPLSQASTTANAGQPQAGKTDTSTPSGALASKLQPMRLRGSTARQLANRDLLLTQGTSIDCALQTRIVSTQPGLVTCHLTRDVYSASGRVVLLDSGSAVTGFYEGGLTQGQGRIFVQWSRVDTPDGVTIDLDSPGAGPLGEGGLGGHVDRHTWQRFGGAILISLIGDVGNWLSNRSSGSDNVQFNSTTQSAENAATEALRNSINIPPTLYKNQGERVAIMVARDLDFSEVYRIEPKR